MLAVAFSLRVSCSSFFHASYCSPLFVLFVALFFMLADAFLVLLAIAFLFWFVAYPHCAWCCSLHPA